MATSTVRVTNISNAPLTLGMDISVPKAWKPVNKFNSEAFAKFTLAPAETKAVSSFLLESASNAVSNWDSIRVRVWESGRADTSFHYPLIRTRERPDFSVRQHSSSQEIIPDSIEHILMETTVRNNGNVPDIYTVNYLNNFLSIHHTSQFELQPGRDTLLVFKEKISRSQLKSFYAEDINVLISGARAKKSTHFTYKVYRLTNTTFRTRKTQESFPIRIGGGLMTNDQRTTYYGEIQGNLRRGEHALSFSYRSKDFGTELAAYQRNVFYLGYYYKKFSVEAGQIQGPRNFFTNGQGLSLAYRNGRTMVTVAGLKHSKLNGSPKYKNDNLYGTIRYPVKNVNLEHAVESNFNEYFNINSYVFINRLELVKTKTTAFRIYAGAGLEHRLNEVPGVEPMLPGYSGGFDLNKKFKNFLIQSNSSYNSSDYPGIYKGIHTQFHQLRYLMNNHFVGGFYRYNATERNTLRDTLYNTDYLAINNSRYGLSAGKYRGKARYELSAGLFDQVGALYDLRNGKFIDGSFQLSWGEASNFSVYSSNVFRPQEDGEAVYITTNRLSFFTRFFNLSGSYNRIPTYSEGSKTITSYRETVNGGPGISFGLFNRSLRVMARYQISKTMSEEVIRNGVGGSINYTNNKIGLNLGMSGFYPLKDPTNIEIPVAESRNGSAYISKVINVPVKRFRLYDLKAKLFHDENGNGTFDENESVLSNAEVVIDNKTLVSDSRGVVRYRNVEPGVYELSFVNSGSRLVSTKGPLLTIDLIEDTEVQIPFKRGLKLLGNLNVVSDSMSTVNITAANFKIIVKDTAGTVYHSFTDEGGNFYIYLPEGKYSVSLNPEAFEGNNFKPEQMSYDVVVSEADNAFVQFTVTQKKRKVRYLSDNK